MPDGNWLEQVYREHRRALFLTAWNRVRCPNLAEDAVHSAFARLAELPTIPIDPKLYAFRAVRNAAIDLSRRIGLRTEQSISDGMTKSEDQATDDRPGLSDAVEQALDQLDDRSREVVELHLHSELTFHNIAALCKEPLQTVASRYRRALEKLRRLIEVCYERD